MCAIKLNAQQSGSNHDSDGVLFLANLIPLFVAYPREYKYPRFRPYLAG